MTRNCKKHSNAKTPGVCVVCLHEQLEKAEARERRLWACIRHGIDGRRTAQRVAIQEGDPDALCAALGIEVE